MERFKIEEAFTTLKPLCDAFIKNPTVKDANSIGEIVSNISNAVVQDLLEYILYPFITHLQNESISKDVKEHMVNTIRVVIQKTKIKKLEYFNKLYACLLIQIFDKNSPHMILPLHEELKEAVLLCIKNLLHCCYIEVIESLYVRENAPKIGQGILLCITVARKEKSSALKMAAIEAVMALCQIDESSDKSDIILQSQIADVIMIFLPGITSGLQEIAIGNEIQSHKVTVMAIRAWGRVISLIMQDIPDENPIVLDSLIKRDKNIYDAPFNSLNSKTTVDLDKLLKGTTRNQEWFDAAATKFKILVQELEILTTHSHYKVRKELTQTINLILTTCSRNMKPNVTKLIEYLISLSEDDNVEVSEIAKEALNTINTRCTRDRDMKPLIEVMEESFYNLLVKLPRIIRRSDDGEQLSCLNQLAGYLRLLGKRLSYIMTSTAHLRKLLLALVYISEMDCSNVSLLEDISVKDFDDSTHYYVSTSWRQFKFIHDSSCKEKLVRVCELLGKYGDFQILMDNVFILISDAPQHRNELILLLNWAINGADATASFLYEDIVNFYITESFWYLPIEVTENISLATAQNNVVLSCLLTEGLGIIGKNLKYDSDRFLLKTLYLIIERAGSAHGLISFIGITTLEIIAESQGYKTIADLLRANVDYFSYYVTIKLRRVERNPGVLDVIGIVMKYSTIDVLPCLKEIVEDVLLQLNTSFQKKNSYAFLKVFHVFIMCIKNLMQCESLELPEARDTAVECNMAETVIQSLLKYYEAKKVDEKIEEDFINTPEDVLKSDDEDILQSDSIQEEEKEADVPSYVKMIEEILKRCLHFLPSKEIQQSLIAMLTLQEGIQVLRKWENQSLPIIHLLWHPLVDRFNDQNVLIINRAWQLLRVLACISQDFIRSRTLKQILPPLSKFLTTSAKESYNKDMHHVYKFTQMYKLQKELLSGLGETVKYLKAHERELWDVLSITEPYLSVRQHPVLQTCCTKLYKDIADYNEDIVWVKCLSIWNAKVSRTASNATFKMQDLQICESISENEYRKNIETIIVHIRTGDSDMQ